MAACTHSELGPHYEAASEALIKEITRVVTNEFELLEFQQFDDSYKTFLALPRQIVEYLERLLKRMSNSIYHEVLLRLHFDFDRNQSAIDVWRRSQPEHIDPSSFKHLSPDKQFEAIKQTDPHNPRHMEMVRDFASAYNCALQTAKQLMNADTDTPANALVQAVEEVRVRASYASNLVGVNIDMTKVVKLEQELLNHRNALEASIDGILRGTPPPDDAGRRPWDRILKTMLDQYLQLVKLTPGYQPSSVPGIISLLVEKLKETTNQCLALPDCIQQLQLKSEAFQRLQAWELSGSAGPMGCSGGLSLFETVAQLEKALCQDGSISSEVLHMAELQSQANTHNMRMHEIHQQIVTQIDAAMTCLDASASFDAKKDHVLDPKPFEVILSREMDALIGLVHSNLHMQVKKLKTKVEKIAQDNLQELQTKLKCKKYSAANLVLQRWKFLEPLSSLAVFSSLPGPNASDAMLKDHCNKLTSAAESALNAHLMAAKVDKVVALPILWLAKFGSDIARASVFVNYAMADTLRLAESKLGTSGMQSLASELRRLDPALGNEIVSSSDAFQTLVIEEFNEKTKRDISVVKKLFAEKNEHIEDGLVWDKYDKFKTAYDDYLQQCIGVFQEMDDPLDWLVQQAKNHVGTDKQKDRKSHRLRTVVTRIPLGSQGAAAMGYNLGNCQEQVPKVLAAIFAWWTVEFYLRLKKRNPDMPTDTAKLRHANNGQVVCLLRLLGATTKGFIELKNHLAEVPTGEGKSVILGVLATTLALYGYNVDCVCYSSMLSSRDCDDFASMFKSFGVSSQVRYGTFDDLSEALIKEQYGDLRQAANNYIVGAACSKEPQQAPPPRVLIIDEVDVFCSEAFFGGAYCPQLEIKNDAVARLMRYIWSIRKVRLDLGSLKGHPSYQAVLRSGVLKEESVWLLERSVQQMHMVAKVFVPDVHDLKIEHGRILYKVEGRDDYASWSYGYETNAEYLDKFEKGNLTEAQLLSGLALHVRCGEFAFAKLPDAFKHILGVTGTLDKSKLPPQMLEVLRKEVQIEHFTYCPSMYHSQKRDFRPDSRAYVQLAKDEDEHFNMIADEINLRLKPTLNMEGMRSVIVFFRDEKELQHFRSSSYFGAHQSKAGVLTELTAALREDRDNIIKAATRQGMVTLASRMYGRGTDFKIFDDRMEACGGLHVLQTFFSGDLSEEVQIQGRSARQGNQGSYSLVLEVNLLAKQFDQQVQTMIGWPAEEVYANLAKLREARAAGEVQSLRDMAAKRKKEHGILIDALKAFSGGKADAMETVMRRYNTSTGLVMGGNGLHIIFCLDESWSMCDAGWTELVSAFNRFWQTRAAEQSGTPEYASVVQFSDTARVTHTMQVVHGPAPSITFQGGYTEFVPPIRHVCELVANYGPAQGYTVVVVFMSDGAAGDAAGAANLLERLASEHLSQFACYTVGFGASASCTLASMAFSNGVQETGNYHTADIGSLGEAFAVVASSIAPGRV